MGGSDIVKTASGPVEKLIDTVSHAIGKAYEPRYTRRMADAKAYEIRTISEELRNNCDLPIIYNGDYPTIDISDYDSLRQRAGARLAFQEIQKQANIESIVDKACDEISDIETVSEEPVNPDWMSRFITNAGEVSDEEMQCFWAKVLTGEVIQPKSFSLRTLDCIKNLTADDAQLFTKIAQFIVQDCYLCNDEELNRKYGIIYDDILKLDDCGLINSSGLISLNYTVQADPIVLLDFEDYVLLGKCKNGGTQKVSIGEFPLTQTGKELLKIARTSSYGVDYIQQIANIVKSKANRCEVSIHKVLVRDGIKIKYEREKTIFSDFAE